jgi:hypothetical protein
VVVRVVGMVETEWFSQFVLSVVRSALYLSEVGYTRVWSLASNGCLFK